MQQLLLEVPAVPVYLLQLMELQQLVQAAVAAQLNHKAPAQSQVVQVVQEAVVQVQLTKQVLKVLMV
jgi:hypothetical protein